MVGSYEALVASREPATVVMGSERMLGTPPETAVVAKAVCRSGTSNESVRRSLVKGIHLFDHLCGILILFPGCLLA